MFTALSAVSLNDLQPSTGTGVQSNTPGVNAPKQIPTPVPQADTVKLSVTQQVRNLHSEGEGPGQIASSLGLDSSQVNGDLYVSLTWPELLSKVASSSLTLGSAPTDASAAEVVAPVSGAATPPAAVFPANKSASGSSSAATPGTKDTSASAAAIFPRAKDAFATGAAIFPSTKDSLTPTGPAVFASKDAVAA